MTKRPRPIVVNDECASLACVVVAFNTTSSDAPTCERSSDSGPSLDNSLATGEMGALCGPDAGDTELTSDRVTDERPSCEWAGACAWLRGGATCGPGRHRDSNPSSGRGEFGATAGDILGDCTGDTRFVLCKLE